MSLMSLMSLRLTLATLSVLVCGCGSDVGRSSPKGDAGFGGAIGGGGSGEDASAGSGGLGGSSTGGSGSGGIAGTGAGGTSAGGTSAGGTSAGGTSAGGTGGSSTGGTGGAAGAGATTGASCATPPTSLSPRWVFFEGGTALNAVDVATGSPSAPVVVSDGLTQARFSPDGQSFAYTNASAELFAVSVGATLGAPQTIATSVFSHGWSPNSEWLSYLRDVGAVSELYATRHVGASFQAPQKVNGGLPGNGDVTAHVWSPSSQMLAFNVDTGPAPVFVSDFGSGAPGTPLQVAGGAAGYYWDTSRIAWSPASDSIVHGIKKSPTDHALDLVKVGSGSPLDGTPVVTKSCESIGLEWASLPGRYAFTTRDPASCYSTSLYVVTSPGSSPVKVADGVHDFHFSADGTWLAYLQFPTQRVSLVPLTAAGPGAVQLVSPDDTTAYAWSPNGKHIAFNSTVQNRKHLFLASVNATTTGAAVQITPNSPNIDVESVNSSDDAPLFAWSPDAKRLLFRSRRLFPGTFVYMTDLFYVDATQTPATPIQVNSLPVEGSQVVSMAWARSSEYFVYHADHQQKGLHQLYFVALDGATPCAPLVLSGGKPVYKSSSPNYWLAPN